jgi:hypothetical protein
MTVLDTDLTMVEEELAEAMRLTHIVAPSDNASICHAMGNGSWITGADIVHYAKSNNVEVTALCGFRWIPVNDPTKYDTCGACLEEAHKRMEEENT